MTELSVRAQIRELNRLDPDEVPYPDLVASYDKLLSGVSTLVGLSQGSELFFRARVGPSTKPLNVTDLGAPPANVVRGFQRCNAPHTPMFYSASKRRTALLESRARTGDIVYLSQWIGQDRIPINRMLDESSVDAIDKVSTDLDALIHSHIDTIFTRRIHVDFSNDYKFSAALSEKLTKNFPENTDQKVGSDGIVGLRYPSVFDRKGSYNTVFPAEHAAKHLKLAHVMEAEVLEAHGMHIAINVLDNAVDFTGGVVRWTGNSALIPLPRRDNAVAFRFDGRNWLLAVMETSPSPTDIRNLLIE